MSAKDVSHWLSGFFVCAECEAKYLYQNKKRRILQHDTKKGGCLNELKSLPVELIELLVDVAFMNWLLEQAKNRRLTVNYEDLCEIGDERCLFQQAFRWNIEHENNFEALRKELSSETDPGKKQAIREKLEAIVADVGDYLSIFKENDQKACLRWILDHYDTESTPRQYIHAARVFDDHLELEFEGSSSWDSSNVKIELRSRINYADLDQEVQKAKIEKNAVNSRLKEFLGD